MFEDANNAGEIIMPPAGAVGRGDAFILQVAEKADAAVLSNDSFQEFHGEHQWLFDEGRLIGGKPVEGIGWVFVPRVPVRGPASRRATRDAKDGKSSSSSSGRSSRSGRSGRSTKGRKASRESQKRSAQGPPPTPTAATPPPGSGNRRSGAADKDSDRRKSQRRSRSKSEPPEADEAAPEADTTSGTGSRSKKKKNESDGGGKSKSQKNVQELNSARDFMLFVTQHSIGDDVSGVVDRFSSHGCYLFASSAQCYLPSSAMGDPPPSKARDVVSLGQTVIVRVESIDSDRRGINVVLVRTVSDGGTKQEKPAAGDSRGTKARSTSQLQASVADETAREANLTRSKTTVATTKSAKKSQKRPAAKKATKKKAAEATTSARATKAAARRTPTKKATKKTPAKKTATKATAKKATTKKATKKTPAKKTATKSTAKKATTKKATKKTTGAAKKSTAKR